MIHGKTIVVVMPAYNAARTLRQNYGEVTALNVVGRVIIVDDASDDDTVTIARTLAGARVVVHEENRGYGANQKSCVPGSRILGGYALKGGMPWWMAWDAC